MIAEDEAVVVFSPSPWLMALQARALPVCHMCDGASRRRAGCSSERVGRALTGQGVDSGCTLNALISHRTFCSTQDCLTALAQEALLISQPRVL